jgi:hypothetical protein
VSHKKAYLLVCFGFLRLSFGFVFGMNGAGISRGFENQKDAWTIGLYSGQRERAREIGYHKEGAPSSPTLAFSLTYKPIC